MRRVILNSIGRMLALVLLAEVSGCASHHTTCEVHRLPLKEYYPSVQVSEGGITYGTDAGTYFALDPAAPHLKTDVLYVPQGTRVTLPHYYCDACCAVYEQRFSRRTLPPKDNAITPPKASASSDQRFPLHEAALVGNSVLIDKLLSEQTHDPNERDEGGEAALHIAARNGDVTTIALLIEKGAAININDINKFTPLHIAASRGNTGAVDALLRAGAKINPHAGQHLVTPYDLSILFGHKETAALLHARGGRPSRRAY